MPGLAVIVAVIEDGKVLLTKREDFEVWCLPGGGVEEGDASTRCTCKLDRCCDVVR